MKHYVKETVGLIAILLIILGFITFINKFLNSPPKDFKVGECIVDSTIPPWDKNNTSMVSKVLQTSSNHVQLTQAPYYLGKYTMVKKDLQDFEVVECPPVEVLPEEEAGETCGH